ncbi:MAG: isovaleryl-CoA dehydrogenase [Pseudolabrys sp.]|nr:isovaleryl-CoA dehydrogenase [Pseudolabrys sp.]MDP2294081.1 isovaleryl-CoA dehydrogenase [Pseudolabrys sp.]
MFEVQNQPPPLEPYNLFVSDQVLREAVRRENAEWAEGGLNALGVTLGKPETVKLGFDANKFTPQLRTLDRYGHRLDEVEFHPAWHELMAIALRAGLHSSPWAHPQPGAHVARAAGTYMLNQIESGVYCPVAMTYGAVPTLRHAPDVAAQWLPKIYGRDYDRRFAPVGQKSAALFGMGMTENQGGSDLRTNTTRAEPAGDGSYRLHGHKWFMSAPMCDAFLVLAQTEKGLSCFLLPRWTPDGERNAIQIIRLKDKLGNKSNASSEVEFAGAYAQMIGEEGRGIPTIIEMGNYTRLDCAIGSSSLMRQAVVQAIHHARHRTVFQKKLIDQPLMANVLADMALESEAAAVLTFRLARAYDEEGEIAQVFRRVLTPAAKFWICKRTPMVTSEAMEVLGGSGYIEESIMPRLYREAPVNSIWEGSGNVMCLDVLRAIGRTANAADVLRHELASDEPRLKAFAGKLDKRMGGADRNDEAQARVLVRDLVLALQAALLIKHAPHAVADAFCASRLSGEGGGAFGMLPRGCDLRAIAERAAPLH